VGQSLRDIRKRIGSVKSTQQITKAMKMVAAAKLRRAEERARAFAPWAEGYEELLRSVLARIEGEVRIPLAESRTERGTLLLLVAGDRGLCGGYNSNVFRLAARLITEEQDEPLLCAAVGKKAVEWARKRNLELVGSWQKLEQPPASVTVVELGRAVSEPFIEGRVRRVVVVYNRFESAMTQVPETRTLLPFSAPPGEEDDGPMSAGYPYLSDVPLTELVPDLVRQVFQATLMRILLDAQAGEHGARMTAMDSATTNATEMIDRLTLLYNRARQAAITNELMDIVNGAEALR